MHATRSICQVAVDQLAPPGGHVPGCSTAPRPLAAGPSCQTGQPQMQPQHAAHISGDKKHNCPHQPWQKHSCYFLLQAASCNKSCKPPQPQSGALHTRASASTGKLQTPEMHSMTTRTNHAAPAYQTHLRYAKCGSYNPAGHACIGNLHVGSSNMATTRIIAFVSIS